MTLADLLDRLAADLGGEVDRLLRRDPAAPVARLLALADVLRRLAESERQRSRRLPDRRLVPLNEWAEENGTPASTARRWAANGQLTGAVRVGREWAVPGEVEAPGTATTGHHDEEQQA